jgi:hypothetical protein
MIKTITIDGKEVQFKASASFPLVYKANFNADILTIIMPLIAELLDGLDDEAMKGGQLELTPSTLAGMLEKVYSLELVDIMNLIWTLAKCADSSIPEPEKWYGEFDEFPIFDVAVEVFPMLFESLFSKKKLSKLAKVKTPKSK